MPLKYVVITPVRSEGDRFERTVASMEFQEQQPARMNFDQLTLIHPDRSKTS